MTAAAITPTVVQIENERYTNKTGTPIRIIKYLVKLTKAAADDWFVAATHTPGTFLDAEGTTLDSSGDGTKEHCTYTASGTKVVLPGAGTGTSHIWVRCQEV